MSNPKNFIIYDIVPPHTPPELSEKKVAEAIRLVDTLTSGTGKVKHVVQQKTHPSSGTYMGSGKIEELIEIVKRDKIDCIVINDVVRAGQIYDLTMAFWATSPDLKVWDKVDLILHIFKKNAHTAEAKMQIEIAAMRHMGPRIFGMGLVMSRQGGGVGTRGIGETNTERMKRHWRSEMRKTEEKIVKLQEDLKERIRKRKDKGIKTVALVGYTNAGKTTLFNALTGKSKLAKDELFATLDSASGYLMNEYDQSSPPRSFEKKSPILITDTIGFMKGMPASLIKAFASTLTETRFADLILHVVDSSDEKIEEKMLIVDDTLHDLTTDHIEKLVVYTKIDLAPGAHIEKIKRIIKTTPGILIAKDDKTSITNLVRAIVATCK